MSEWQDYYGYGAVRDGASWHDGRWKYLAAESDHETTTLHLDAREHDALVGRLWQVDPLWHLYPHQSPYLYGNANPFRFTDRTGMLSDTTLIQEGDPVPNPPQIIVPPNPVDVYLTFTPIGLFRQGSKALARFVVNLVKRILKGDDGKTEMSTPNRGVVDEPNGELNETVELYRGVRKYTPDGKVSPAYEDALEGIVKPRGGIFGHEDPDLHNAGTTESSKFTSWTDDERIANRFAGKDGIVLKARIPKNE